MAGLIRKLRDRFLRAKDVRRREKALAGEKLCHRRSAGGEASALDPLAPMQAPVSRTSPAPSTKLGSSPELETESSAHEIARCLARLSPSLEMHGADMAELYENPLARALARHLDIHYPNLKEYQGLILAEIVELTMTGSDRRSLAQDPNAFIEMAIKRAMVCLAQVRVALRRAVREELASRQKPNGEAGDAVAGNPARDKA